MSLVGFFDILGTRDKVVNDRFCDIDVLEFVNAIGVAAGFTPNIRFVVFSDSLIIATEPTQIRSLLQALNFMYGNWFSELVYVRGAFSCGDVRWVDDAVSDKHFRRLSNLTYCRIYGKGLVSAYQLEQSSGPGAVCFLTKEAAALFREKETASVLDGNVPMLCWATSRQAKIADKYASSHLERSQKDSPEWKQAAATKHYWTSVLTQSKFLPDEYEKTSSL